MINFQVHDLMRMKSSDSLASGIRLQVVLAHEKLDLVHHQRVVVARNHRQRPKLVLESQHRHRLVHVRVENQRLDRHHLVDEDAGVDKCVTDDVFVLQLLQIHLLPHRHHEEVTPGDGRHRILLLLGVDLLQLVRLVLGPRLVGLRHYLDEVENQDPP